MRRCLRRLPLVTVVLGTAALASACGGTQTAASSGRPGAGGGGGRPPRSALRVRVSPVQVQDVVHQIKALGSLEAQDLVQVTDQVEGVATDVRFREGDRVGPASVLLRIDPDRYRVEAQQAKAAKDQATAELGRAQADLQRREALAQNELLSAEELTRSRGENARLSAGLEVSKAAYE